jgi:hypothetical protein
MTVALGRSYRFPTNRERAGRTTGAISEIVHVLPVVGLPICRRSTSTILQSVPPLDDASDLAMAV